MVTNFIIVSNRTLKAETIGEDYGHIRTSVHINRKDTQVACLTMCLKVLSLMFGGDRINKPEISD